MLWKAESLQFQSLLPVAVVLRNQIDEISYFRHVSSSICLVIILFAQEGSTVYFFFQQLILRYLIADRN